MFIVCSVNGKVENLPIYKRGQDYGFLDDEECTTVEHFVAVFSRTGFTMNEGMTSVTLTNQLFPDK